MYAEIIKYKVLSLWASLVMAQLAPDSRGLQFVSHNCEKMTQRTVRYTILSITIPDSLRAI